MNKINNNDVAQFREAFKQLLIEKTKWRIDRGQMDEHIKDFLNGDALDLDFSISLLPNDIIFMTALIGRHMNNEKRTKIYSLWDKE